MTRVFTMTVLFLLGLSPHSMAHFGMVIPSDSMVMAGESRTVSFSLSFSHPFELIGLELSKPQVKIYGPQGDAKGLANQLVKTAFLSQSAWQFNFRIRQPGSFWILMEPQPYWEPMEDCYIIHYTKTMVTAFGDDEGWDRELGIKTEIVPLSKPFGLYAGNVFQGIVKLDGKAVPYAAVEVEHYNQNDRVQAPTELMVTQTVKADGNGVFTYAAPAPGWWGFAALNEANYKLKHQSGEKSVELGAVIWVKFHKWKAP